MNVERKDHKKTIKVSKETCKQIYEIMKSHKGKNNAIPSKTISAILGFPLEDTQVHCRTCISATADMYRIPIIGCSKGYFLAANKDEVSNYCASMNSRIRGMKQTKNKVVKYFNEQMERGEID